MTTTAQDSTVHLTTEEGHEVTLSRRDFDTLKAWPLLDVTRLVVVGEDAVHARRKDGTVHPQSLEDLLALVRYPDVEAPKCPPRPGSLMEHFLRTGKAGIPPRIVTPPPETKVCACCGKSKPASRFGVWRWGPDGLTSNCKTCATKLRRKRQAFLASHPAPGCVIVPADGGEAKRKQPSPRGAP